MEPVLELVLVDQLGLEVTEIYLCLPSAEIKGMPINQAVGFLIFYRITILISKVADSIHNPINNGGMFPYLYILSSLSCHQCFNLAYFYRCKRESQICLDFHFSND